MVVLTGVQVFVLEFKMAANEEDAAAALDAGIAQMRAHGEPIHLISVAYGREARNLLKIRAAPA